MERQEWDVEHHLYGRPPQIVALYRRFITMAAECGPFTYAVSKSAITLKGERRGFAGAALSATHLKVYLDLPWQIADDPRRVRSDPYGKRLFVHHFRIAAVDELDETFRGWLSAAYEVGQGMHLAGPTIR